MHIEIKRIYDPPAADDGTRVLVDRLWPRGVSKDEVEFDHWAKDLAPSDDLRKWFDHDPEKFDAFAKKYRAELRDNPQAVDDLLEKIDRRKRLTLLYGAKDPEHNHAVVLKRYLEQVT